MTHRAALLILIPSLLFASHGCAFMVGQNVQANRTLAEPPPEKEYFTATCRRCGDAAEWSPVTVTDTKPEEAPHAR